MRKFLSLLMAVMAVVSLSAKTIYLNTGGASLWHQADAVFFVHSWGGEETVDVLMSQIDETDVFQATIPDDNNSIVFVRMAPGSEAINWDTKWNQTVDLTIPADKDCFTMTSWNNGEWSVYTPAGSGEEPVTPPAPAAKDSIYFVNVAGWETPVVHLWGGTAEGTTWPGVAMIKLADQINNFDVYKYVADAGAYANCIFSNNGANQTANLDWTSGMYFYDGAWYALDAIPAPEVPAKYYITGDSALVGAELKWHPDAIKVMEDEYVFENLVAGDYKLKVTVNGDWSTGKGYSDLTVKAEGLSADNDNNVVFTLAEAGNVTVVYNDSVFTVSGNFYVEPIIVPDPTVAVIGSMTQWAEAIPFVLAEDKLSASLSDTIPAGEYEFKMLINGEYRSNGWWFNRNVLGAANITEDNSANMLLQADVKGLYTFTWFFANDSLAMEFPEAPVVIPAKYYITGDSALVGAELKWHPDAIKVMEDEYIFENLAAGDYKLKVTVNGDWSTGKGYSDLTVKAEGLSADNDNNVVFTLAEAGNVTVVYNDSVFTVSGNFYVEPEPQPAEAAYYLVGSMTEWAVVADDAHKFVASEETEGEMTLVWTLAEGDEFKVVKIEEGQDTVWYPAQKGNYVVDAAHAGEKTIYFRPNYNGNADWHAGCIFVIANEPVDLGPWEAWFGDADWNTENDSYLTYDAETGKATAHINQDKAGQWHAQVKYHGPIAEAGKFYHVGLKMKSNHAMTGVTIKWVDNVEMLYENQTVALEENVEYVYNAASVAGIAGGNGVMVLDFGSAHAGDVVEIYDVVIEEVEAPVIDLEDGYYAIGLNGWTIYSLTAADKFVASAETEGEYELVKTLAVGNEFKVVAVANNALGAWYPGEAGNYVVDAAHAGEKTIYFRPNYNGNEDWHAACIFVPATEGPDMGPIQSTWFANTSWQQEFESTIVWDPETEKITINVAVDKNDQWQAQLKLNTLAAEEGKCYNVAFKLKANNAVTNITFKWQDNNNDPNLIFENRTIALEAGVEFAYNKTVAGIPGNAIAIFDFGFAHAGDIIEIYDFAITETECPQPEYYLVGHFAGVASWAPVAERRLVVNPDNEAEFMINVTLTENDSLKVVKVLDDAITWYPAEAGNYVVDADHAGETTIYFRPDYQGGEDWYAGCIYVLSTSHVDVQNVNADVKAVKVVRDGQILIIRGEHSYTVMGQLIK